MPMNRLDGKIAIITGGTQGLGATIARHFANLGAEGLITCGRNSINGNQIAQSIMSETGVKVCFVKTDLAQINQVKKIVPVAKKIFGTQSKTRKNWDLLLNGCLLEI